MTDVHEPEVRSYNMSRIKSKDTKPEMIVRRYLHQHGFRYRLHVKDLPGKPDIVLPKYKTIVDVRGCFWHGHQNCKFGDKVETPSKHYQKRIEDAITRDKRNIIEWEKLGWNVIIIWDRCELEDKRKYSDKREVTLNLLKQKILSFNENTSN